MNTTALNRTKVLIGIVFIALSTQTASAGLLDKLNAAAQKLNEKTQQMQTGKAQQPAEDPDKPLHMEDHAWVL